MSKKRIRILIPAMVACIDQAIKCFIRQKPVSYRFWRADGFAEIIRCANSGAAFSILSGRTQLLALATAILLLGILFLMFRYLNLTRSAEIAAMFLLGGGFGNLIDRVFFHEVTDYIRVLFIDFPVFNFADIAITSSIVMLIYLLFIGNLERDTAGDRHGTNN